MNNREVKICSVFAILFTAAGFFILPKNTNASSGDVHINEIYNNPKGADNSSDIGKKSYEFIELKNFSSSSKDIKNWEIRAGTYFSLFSLQAQIPSDGMVVIYEGLGANTNTDFSDGKVAYLYMNKSGSQLGDGYGDVTLYKSSTENASTIADYVSYGKISSTTNSKHAYDSGIWDKNDFIVDFLEGKSMELKNDDNNLSSDWQTSYVLGGTPGKENFSGDDKPEEKPKLKEYSNKIRINEILPNPDGSDKDNEFIELYNFNDKPIDLNSWSIKSAKIENSKEESVHEFILSEEYCKTRADKCIVDPEKFFVIKSSDYKFTLLNSALEKIDLLNPNIDLVDTATYGISSQGASYNFDGIGWHWSSKLSPGKENILNNLPVSKLKIEKKIYKNMLAEFNVSANDKDGDKLKFIWDFGDGHKSYLQKTSHKYEKEGIYTVSLKISDGSEDILETFEIEAGKFPKSELKIVGVKANPKGKDTDLETIKIKNTSKKKINLKNWSVATGWKELYNHPISKKLIIKSGETKELTRKYSLFALNNKQAKIELRRPDGSVASKVKYSKKEGIQDDETYEKTENGWEWDAPINTEETQNDADSTQTSTEDLQNSATEDQEKAEENLSNENKPENQTENNLEIQSDEPVESGEVLGAETSKNIEITSDKPTSGSFFQKIIWGANRLTNNLINFFV